MPDQLVAEYEGLRYLGVAEVNGRSASYCQIAEIEVVQWRAANKPRGATCRTIIYNIYREKLITKI